MRAKQYILIILSLLCFNGMQGQQYNIAFTLEGCQDSVLYIGQHFRDEIKIMDSAKIKNGQYIFRGKRSWERGIYALVQQDRKKSIGDFCIDGSAKFSITADEKLTPTSVRVKGSEVNQQMFAYLATEKEASQQMEEIRNRKKDPATRTQAEADEAKLIERIEKYEDEMLHSKAANIFFEITLLCEPPFVSDTVADKPVYYRRHYWDSLFYSTNENKGLKDLRRELLHSPQLFSKMNYFFFGMLYYADSDTICAEIDRLAERIGDDTALLRYVFDHIEPRYFRSTKNVGWDAVWCHLAKEYYLKGKCPWATEGTIHNMKYNYNRISQSIIGVHGQELWMADTNQSADQKDWISSHRFPTKYVILWFWDPDCHHCQEQSAALKILYDSLRAAGNNRFEIYAVGFESDVDKWKKYVREHDFRWVNVGGMNVNIDYQEAYNVHGAPTMIILNEKRDIIMNKVLPAKNILQFLDEYERKAEAKKKQLQTKP